MLRLCIVLAPPWGWTRSQVLRFKRLHGTGPLYVYSLEAGFDPARPELSI